MKDKNQSQEPQPYGRKLSLRLTDEEYRILERKAAEYGGNVSTAIRQLLFGRTSAGSVPIPDGDAKYKTLLAVQQCRVSFKKIASRFSDAVAVYDRSIDAVDENGRRIVSTTQPFRHIAGLEDTILGLQKNMNVLFETLGVQPVFYAAKMRPDSRVGQQVAEFRKAQSSVDSGAPIPEEKSDIEQLSPLTKLPQKDKYMFKANIIGEIIDEPISFITKKGTDMMKFHVRTMSGIGGKENEHVLDIVRTKSEVFPLLHKGNGVFVYGDMNIEKFAKENQVVIGKTVFADTIVPMPMDGSESAFPKKFRFSLKSMIAGELVEDAIEYVNKKEIVMMRFKVRVNTYIGGRETVHIISVARVKNGLFPFLKKDVGVAVVGDFDIAEMVDAANQVTIVKSIYADEIRIPPQ